MPSGLGAKDGGVWRCAPQCRAAAVCSRIGGGAPARHGINAAATGAARSRANSGALANPSATNAAPTAAGDAGQTRGRDTGRSTNAGQFHHDRIDRRSGLCQTLGDRGRCGDKSGQYDHRCAVTNPPQPKLALRRVDIERGDIIHAMLCPVGDAVIVPSSLGDSVLVGLVPQRGRSHYGQ